MPDRTESTGKQIGLITCRVGKLGYYFPTVAEPGLLPCEPPFTPDDQLLVDHLRACGHSVRAVVWDDPPMGWRALDALVMRSPWDYMDDTGCRRQFMRFLAELETLAVPVFNAPALMRWLTDKHYLGDMAEAGLAVVSTRFVEAGTGADLTEHYHRMGPLVIKPCISAAGIGLAYLPDEVAAAAFQSQFDKQAGQEAYIIQPFIPEIQTAGEWSLVFIGGCYSHGVHKMPGPDGILVHAERGGSLSFAPPPDDTREFGEACFEKLLRLYRTKFPPSAKAMLTPLFLRMDVIDTANGPLLSECEGVDPELFFRAKPGSEALFSDTLLAWLLNDGYR